jgi:hypothetical protein
MADPLVLEAWNVVGASAALAVALLLSVRHVFALHLGARVRRALNLAILPALAIFLSYVVTRFTG